MFYKVAATLSNVEQAPIPIVAILKCLPTELANVSMAKNGDIPMYGPKPLDPTTHEVIIHVPLDPVMNAVPIPHPFVLVI
jgi:hypothetical protein